MCCPGGGVEEEEEGQWRGGSGRGMWSTIGGREGLTAVAHPTTVTYCQRETFGGRERGREGLRGPPTAPPFSLSPPLPCMRPPASPSNQKRPASGAGGEESDPSG